MNGITVDEVGSKPKASRTTTTPSQAPKRQNRLAIALGKASVSPRTWAVVTCLVLAISGAARYWRNSGYAGLIEAAKHSPFPLAELPTAIGAWKMIDGSDSQLDPRIAQIAGASDHIVRSYVNEMTGETTSVLVLYGLATELFGHTPEVCYPAAGFSGIEGMNDFDLDKHIRYRAGFFKKNDIRVDEYFEVVYAFRFAEEWTPDVSQKWKEFRRHPGMFKIQLARQVSEFDLDKSPNIKFLSDLIQEVEKRRTSAKGKVEPKSS
jgi:hypothetical protein